MGGLQSLDWTSGLDWCTGLVDSLKSFVNLLPGMNSDSVGHRIRPEQDSDFLSPYFKCYYVVL